MFSYFFFLNTKHGVCLCSAYFPPLDVSCRSLHVGWQNSSSFFFLNSCMILCCMCSSLCNHSPVFEHWGSFQHFEVINSAAVNRSVHMCFPVFKVYLQSKLPEARLLRWRVNNSIFISCYQISFHRDVLCSAYLLLFNKPTPNLIA